MYVNWKQEIVYRFNFWMMVVSEILFFCTSIVYIYFLFEVGNIETIAGYSLYDFYFVFALSDLMGLLSMLFVVPTMVKFKTEIHDGRYDFILLRPKSWFITFVRRSWFAASSLSFLYTFLLIAYVSDKISLNLFSWDLLYVVLLIVYGFVLYSLMYWIAGLICLYFPEFHALQALLGSSQSVKQNPRKVYPRWVSWIFRTVFPLMLVVNPVYDLMDGKIDFEYVGYLLLVLLMFVLLFAFMWKDGMRRYDSAA